MSDSTKCPGCPQEGDIPPATYHLELVSSNAEVRAAFPDLTSNSPNVVRPQAYCYTHYVVAYNKFHPTGGIHQQWKTDYVGRWNPYEGLLPA